MPTTLLRVTGGGESDSFRAPAVCHAHLSPASGSDLVSADPPILCQLNQAFPFEAPAMDVVKN